MRSLAVFLPLTLLLGCPRFDAQRRYACDPADSTRPQDCTPDASEPPPVDAGAGDAGTDAGAADGGQPDAGADGGSCTPGAPVCTGCGYVDAGCGQVRACEAFWCPAGQACGVSTPNVCGRPRLCRRGWCWENPLPLASNLNAGYAFDARHVWWVGDDATILFYDGESWQLQEPPLALPLDVQLKGVHGTAPDDVYAVGSQGTLLHFDGARWQLEPRGTSAPNQEYTAVHARVGLPPVAGGVGGTLLLRQGAQWERAPTPPAVSATIRNFAALADGRLLALTSTGDLLREVTAAQPNWTVVGKLPMAPAVSLQRLGSGQLLAVGRVDGGVSAGVLSEAYEVTGTPVRLAQWDAGVFTAGGASAGDFVVSATNSNIFLVRDGGIVRPVQQSANGYNALVFAGPWTLLAGFNSGLARFSEQGTVEQNLGVTRDAAAVCGSAVSDVFVVTDGTRTCASGSGNCATGLQRRADLAGVRWTDVPTLGTGGKRSLSCHVSDAGVLLVGTTEGGVMARASASATLELLPAAAPASSAPTVAVFGTASSAFAVQAGEGLARANLADGGALQRIADAGALQVLAPLGGNVVALSPSQLLYVRPDNGVEAPRGVGALGTPVAAAAGRFPDAGLGPWVVNATGRVLRLINAGGNTELDTTLPQVPAAVWARSSAPEVFVLGTGAAGDRLDVRSVDGGWSALPLPLASGFTAVWGAPEDGGLRLFLVGATGVVVSTQELRP